VTESHENSHSESHTALWGVNELLSITYGLIIWFAWYSVLRICK